MKVGWSVSDGEMVVSVELITPLVKDTHKPQMPLSQISCRPKLATLKPHIHHNKLKGVYTQRMVWTEYAQSLCW